MIEDLKKDANTRMLKSLDSLSNELVRVRTGRANVGLVEHIKVDYYGVETPLQQVANVSVEDARTLSIMPWEKPLVPLIEKAILNSDLGLNPATAGTTIRIPIPPLTEERRRELVKLVKAEGENAKIAVRNIRRDANSDLKELLKEKEITEDEDRGAQDDIQKLTDKHIAEIDRLIGLKEKELLEI